LWSGKYVGKGNMVRLIEPTKKGKISLEECLDNRRSRRVFSNDSLSLFEVSQILWAGQGISSPRNFRTVPSAGALYPIDLYVVVSNVETLSKGVYKYIPIGHKLEKVKDGDKREELYKSCYSQDSVNMAPLSVVIIGVYDKTMQKYGERGRQYLHIEVGCAVQNIYLEVESLALGTVCIGAFDDAKIRRVLSLSDKEVPFVVMPIGKIKT